MKVAFAGTPAFAEAALAALLAAGWSVPLVLTQPDRPAGRGLKTRSAPVKQTALQHGLTVLQPSSLKAGADADAALQRLRSCAAGQPPDVLIVAAYGLILPAAVLTIPRLGCLNIHASLLPRWRGAAPVQRAIEDGDAQTGITIMRMDEGLDTGDICLMKTTPINADDTAGSLLTRLSSIGAAAILEALEALQAGTLPRLPQPSTGATYASKIFKEEAWLDWNMDAARLERLLRAFDPTPGGMAQLPVERHVLSQSATPDVCGGALELLKIWAARVHDDSALPTNTTPPGTILRFDLAGLLIQCRRGRLLLTEAQRPGARRQAVWQALCGRTFKPGDRLYGREGAKVE
jgi:methionyl-tRNA formyltransferase